MKRKIYVETSVISYLTTRPSQTIIGAAHQQITLAWWETRNRYELLVSELVLRECGAGDPDAAAKRLAKRLAKSHSIIGAETVQNFVDVSLKPRRVPGFERHPLVLHFVPERLDAVQFRAVGWQEVKR